MSDIIKCKDCKHFEKWPMISEAKKKYGQLYSCALLVITNPSPDDYCSKAERKEDQKLGKWIPISEELPKEG